MTQSIFHDGRDEQLASRRILAAGLLYLLASLVAIIVAWPAHGVQSLGGDEGPRALAITAVVQLVSLLLLTPILVAWPLAGLNQAGFPADRVATGRPPGVALGRLAGTLIGPIALVLVGLPMTVMAALLGGVSIPQTMAVAVMLLLASLLTGALAAATGAASHQPIMAVVTTWIIMAVLSAFALPSWPIAASFVSGMGPLIHKVFHVLAGISPLQAVLSVAAPDSAYVKPVAGMPPLWLICMAVTVLLLLDAWGTLRKRIVRARTHGQTNSSSATTK